MEIKLKIKIKDTEIELSENEAKELLNMLENLIGNDLKKEIIIERIVDRNVWIPYRHIYDFFDSGTPVTPDYYKVTCGSSCDVSMCVVS